MQQQTTTAIPQSDLANGFYSGVCTVGKYMRDSAKPMLEGVLNPSSQEQGIQALFLRSLCWMTTLEKLNNPQDFQAIAACTRALLEATVDVTLLCHDGRQGQAGQKMLDWVCSAKFKICEQVINFYAKQGRAVPDEHQPMVEFYDRQKSLVPGLRSAHWKGKHPERWTSRNLPDDCVVADGLEGPMASAEMGMTLSEFYHTQIRRLNWSIHASGVAGVHDISYPSICGQCALAFKYSADLAMMTTKLALRNAGFTAVSQQIETDWDALRANRLLVVKEVVTKSLSIPNS
jgi:hypothetical protein